MSIPADKTKTDIKEFTPTPIQGLDIDLGIEDQTPPPAPVQPVQNPPVETPPAAEDEPFDIKVKLPEKPEERQKPGPKPGAAMREQLEKVATEKKELETKLAEAERLRAEREAEAKALKDEMEQVRSKANLTNANANPMDHPRIKSISDPMNKAVENFARQAELTHGTDPSEVFQAVMAASKLVAQLDPSLPEYRQKLADIRKSVMSKFDEEVARDIMRHAGDGGEAIKQIRSVMTELQENAPKVEYEHRKQQYETAAMSYLQIEKDMFTPTAEIIKNDPFNHKAILKGFIDASPEVKQAAESCMDFARLVVLPQEPLAPDAFAGLSDVDRDKKIKDSTKRVAAARAMVPKVLAEAMLCRALLPSLAKRLADAEKAMKHERKATRFKADEGNGEEFNDDEDGTAPDIRKFVPSNPALDDLRTAR